MVSVFVLHVIFGGVWRERSSVGEWRPHGGEKQQANPNIKVLPNTSLCLGLEKSPLL